MTGLFEMRIEVGGDPRDFAEYAALQAELTKLSHPACPDVDWYRVEQLCLTLFQRNGADLHSVAAFVLARSQCQGPVGMARGMALLDALGCEWSNVWPPMASARLDILTWLFAQLQSLMRSVPLNTQSLPALVQLADELLRVQIRLNHQLAVPLVTLQALHQQVEHLIQRLQQKSASNGALQLSMCSPVPPPVVPVMNWPSRPLPVIQPKKRQGALWAFTAAAMFLLAGGVWWGIAANSQDVQQLAGLFPQDKTIPTPVRLDSLALFDAGSAELKPGSTKVLINALVNIKAQPGWLIVISGHSDDRGNAEQNLELSQARALAVRGWMQRMGDIPDSCFAVQGLADSQPIASNDSSSGRAANRRVDINLVPQAGACTQSA
jgi:type VI secretion system protein VasL